MDPEWADQERNTHWSKIHTYIQNHSINSLADVSIRVSRQREKQLLLVKHTQHNTKSFSKTHQLMLAMKQADKMEAGYTSGQISTCTCINTRQFSKTHLLMLAMEQADKDRNKLLLVEHSHICNTGPFIKTHSLMLAIDWADKNKNRLLLVKHWHTHNTRSFSKSHQLMLAMKQAYKKRKWLLLVKYSHTHNTRPFIH